MRFTNPAPSPGLYVPNASVYRTSVTTTAITFLTQNAYRLAASIFNDGATTLYVLQGLGTPSAINYTVALVAGAYYELPIIGNGVPYRGPISGVWAGTGTGGAQVTELY